MSNPRKIEQLDEAIELQDDDLVFASVQDSENTYVSKKVTLANIANYARNSMQPVEPGSSGYKEYDLSQDNTDYFYETEVNFIPTNTDIFEHRFSQDCKILLRCNPTSYYAWSNRGPEGLVKIDDTSIHYGLLSVGETVFDPMATVFVKAGQTLTVDASKVTISESGVEGPRGFLITSLPLKSGGDFFIDTSVQLEEPFTHYYHDGNSTQTTFTATGKTLFSWGTGSKSAQTQNIQQFNPFSYTPVIQLNGCRIPAHLCFTNRTGESGTTGGTYSFYFYDRLILNADDVLTISGSSIYYCALPLLDS